MKVYLVKYGCAYAVVVNEYEGVLIENGGVRLNGHEETIFVEEEDTFYKKVRNQFSKEEINTHTVFDADKYLFEVFTDFELAKKTAKDKYIDLCGALERNVYESVSEYTRFVQSLVTLPDNTKIS